MGPLNYDDEPPSAGRKLQGPEQALPSPATSETQREDAPNPARFRGRMSMDSWIARRDGRSWAAPPVRPESSGRKRSRSSERSENRQEANSHLKISREAHARRDGRRDDVFGRSTVTPQRLTTRPQQGKGKDRQCSGQLDLTRQPLSREGFRSPDRVQASRVGKEYQQQRAAKRKEGETARRVLVRGKQPVDERRRQTEDHHAKSKEEEEEETDDGMPRKMSGARAKR